MKTNKVTKLGVSLLSVAALGVVAPALTDVPVFGSTVVKAEERGPLEYTIAYYDKDTGEEIAPRKTGTINPGEIVNIYKDIDGYQVVSNFDEWMPGFNATYRIVSENFGFSNGRLFMDLSYKKVNADAKPSDTSKPEVKPETKPSETPKPEVKPEPKPSETPKPEVKPETKPSETPKPEVKPEPAPKDEEKQEPLKYRIDYLDADTGEKMFREHGVLNPGETINIHKNIDGYEVVTNRRWMSGYNVDYRLMDRYFGSSSGYRYMFLEYKKVNADAKPSETPKPEVKPETKPSETPKPEVKPEPAPKADENQEPINYFIEYFDAETRERISREIGVLNPGETVNIHKNIDGYEVVSKDSWMPGYNVDYQIISRYFGLMNGYQYMFLDYKKVNADAKPSETPKPAPKDEEKQAPLKYRIDYFDADTGERISREIGVLNPGETINIYKDIEGYEVVSYASWMPGYKVDYRIMNTYFGGTLNDNYMYLKYKKVNADAKPSETPKPEVKPETKPSETPKPEVKPETKPSETPKPEVKPETKPSETPKPEVKPETKPSETPKPEVKPETKPSDTSKPEVKPAPKPSDTSKPEVKPETKPSDTSKPEVKPETKPSETPKPVTPAVPDQPQSAKPEKPVTPSTSRILANEIGSVQVRASEETLKNVSYIKVEETKSNSLTAKNYKAYDIRLYDANGKAVQPNGMVLVSLSAEKPVENVYYVSPDGALQALDFKQDADKVTFETNHFSIYAMTFKNLSVNHNGGSIQTPVAGSENPTTPTQNSNGADGTQPQSKPLKTKGEGGEKTRKTLPNTGENSSILTTLFGVLTLNAGLFSYRKKEK